MTTATLPETPVKRVGPQSTDGKRPEVDAAVEKLDAAIERFINDPSAFREFLRYKGAMHNYSWNNLMLIMIDAWVRKQEESEKSEAWAVENPRKRKGNPYDPERWDSALLTMGYDGWKKQGRQVIRKRTPDNPDGSLPIHLFAPIIVKDQNEDGKIVNKLIGFKVIAKTWHVQDTDGPEFETPTPKPMHDTDDTIDSSRNLCRWLSRTALDDLGVPHVKRSKKYDKFLKQAQGCMIGEQKSDKARKMLETQDLSEGDIIIKSTLSFAQAAKTLAHEMAHTVAEHGKVTNYHSDMQQRAACEAIAEGAAFVVMSHFGYDTKDYTVPYIAGWTQDTNTVKQVLKDISDVSKVIIDKTEAKMGR